ncbi:hypothetical protein MHM88_14535 [Epibacterium sp. MM17-32]|uniref:hypothetical protein n=1 Tax=Epibacterium sp. MM17-32 TaxID=2917734 RepID=UPI001EF63ED4|nr:hypothetical protein [Epibacterium sp. MM17-32]MCG7629025.1 hypothetical protein [Epibacterium sp. MM17-32]
MRPLDLMPEEPERYAYHDWSVVQDTLITEIWDGDLLVQTVPTIVIQAHNDVLKHLYQAYQKGLREGDNRGTRKAQREFRKACGISW